MSGRILVVLDLNGTLLQRLKSQWDLSSLKRSNPGCLVRTNIHGRPIIDRPGRAKFLSTLFSNADVAVWTSAQAKNAIPMVLLGFSGLVSKQFYESELPVDEQDIYHVFSSRDDFPKKLHGDHKLSFLWSQDDCDIVGKRPGSYGKRDFKPDFIKNLEKIWKANPGVYGPSNTIMIDDSHKKILPAHQDNLICIPEFDVMLSPLSATEDDTLPRLTEYLTTLFQAQPQDIREYMRRTPFLNRPAKASVNLS